jgi:adenylate kinase
MQDPNYLLFFVGRPGSGKETQSKLLAEKLGFDIFMTGGKFREIVASGSYLGERIRHIYENGLLMPSWVADYLFQDFVFNLPVEKGAVFEGSGRDIQQAKVIDEVCTFLGRPYTVLNLEVSDEEVAKRSVLRGRDKTDDPKVVETRLAEYRKLTGPAIEHFRSIGKCIDIDGEQTPDKVHEAVMKAVEVLIK